MSFFFPAAFGLLALTPIIVLLYLLKQKRRPAGVPTLMFWQRVVSESKRRVLFRRLRQWLSLLLHLLILTLLVLAIARPEWGRRAEEATVTVLVIDARARMQAAADQPGGPSRFELAVDAAKRAARGATTANPVMIVVAQRHPYVLASLTGDERALINSLGTLQCSDAGGKLEDAVQLASNLLESQAGLKRIAVFTDERLKSVPDKQIALEVETLGRPLDNVGISKLAARSLLNSPQTSEIMLEVVNNRAEAWAGNVELYSDDRLFDVRPLRIPAGQTAVEIYPATAQTNAFVNSRGWLTAKLVGEDALPLDNIAYAVLPSAAPKRILLVSSGNVFLEKLLESDASWKFELLKPDGFNPLTAGSFDVVIFDGSIPKGFDPATATGGYLFLNCHPFATGEEEMKSPVITGSNRKSPLLRLVDTDEVNFSKAKVWQLAEPPGWRSEIVLQSLERPLLISAESEAGSRFVALAFHPLDTDLPMRIAFPLLMSNIVTWLSDRNPPVARSVVTGEFVALPEEGKVLEIPQTKGDTANQAKEENWLSRGFVPEENGYYLVKTKEQQNWFAVNTQDAAMSDLRNTGMESEAASPSANKDLGFGRATAAWRLAFSGQWPLWIYLAIGALILLVLEWGWFHRRKTE